MSAIQKVLVLAGLFLAFGASAAEESGKPLRLASSDFNECLAILLNNQVGNYKKADWKKLHYSTYLEIGKARPLGLEEFINLEALTLADIRELAGIISSSAPPAPSAQKAELHLRFEVMPGELASEDDKVRLAAQRFIFSGEDSQVESLDLGPVELPSLSRFTLRYLKALAMLTLFQRQQWQVLIPQDLWFPWDALNRKLRLEVIARADGSVAITEFYLIDGGGNESTLEISDFNQMGAIVAGAKVSEYPVNHAGVSLKAKMRAELDDQFGQLRDRIGALSTQLGRVADYDRPRPSTERMIKGYSDDLVIHRANRKAVEREIRLLTSLP